MKRNVTETMQTYCNKKPQKPEGRKGGRREKGREGRRREEKGGDEEEEARDRRRKRNTGREERKKNVKQLNQESVTQKRGGDPL